MAFLDLIWAGISSFFSLLGYWLSLFFITPFQNFEVLWILIPIWLNLVVTDFYQEKHGTDLGNAVTNGVTILWVGIDWIRFLLRNYTAFDGNFFLKMIFCLCIIAWGIFITIQGIRGKRIVKIVGRVREISYVMLVLTPFIYTIIEPSWNYLFSILLFFPLFYGIFELIDRSLPDPRTYQEENKNTSRSEPLLNQKF